MRRLFVVGTALVLLMLLPVLLHSQSKPWEPAWQGGPVLALAQHPTNPSIVLAATQGDSTYILFKSTDRGLSWSRRGNVSWCFRGRLMFSPLDERVIYVSTADYSGGIGRSTDGGETWAECPFFSEGYASDILPDPSERLLLHAAGAANERPAYWKGTADGSGWNIHVLNSSLGRCTAIQVEPGNPRNIYVAGNLYSGTAKLWRSTDGGENFSETSIGTNSGCLALDPARPGRIFMVADDAICMSTDFGKSWTKNSGTVPWANTLVVTGGVVYASTWPGIYKSTDGLNYTLVPGTEHFRKARFDGDWSWSCVQDLCVEPTAPHTLLVATAAGVSRSTDGGTSWAPSSSGLNAGRVTALDISPGTPGVLLAASGLDGVYKANAVAALPLLWERLPDFISCDYVRDVAFLPSDPNVIFANEGGG